MKAAASVWVWGQKWRKQQRGGRGREGGGREKMVKVTGGSQVINNELRVQRSARWSSYLRRGVQVPEERRQNRGQRSQTAGTLNIPASCWFTCLLFPQNPCDDITNLSSPCQVLVPHTPACQLSMLENFHLSRELPLKSSCFTPAWRLQSHRTCHSSTIIWGNNQLFVNQLTFREKRQIFTW